ncbi:MAG: hypothetical protein JWR68_2955 [Polaromonas sp.]|nr:hypothetical protein [Polaromonas sp.]
MTPYALNSTGPLAVRVKEPSPGLFFWVVSQLSAKEHLPDVCIDTSDHPYPSHEAALRVGTACLKAYKAAGSESFFSEPNLSAMSPSERH